MKVKNGMALVRVNSHRARDKMKQLLGYLPQGYFVFREQGEYREVPENMLPDVAVITGIRQTKWREDLLGFWS